MDHTVSQFDEVPTKKVDNLPSSTLGKLARAATFLEAAGCALRDPANPHATHEVKAYVRRAHDLIREVLA